MRPHRLLLLCLLVLLYAPSALPAADLTDPDLALQWEISNPAPLPGLGPIYGRAGGDIGAAQAWAQTTGTGVTVAVLDAGADLDHPDLAPNLWQNPGEISGNRRDDDNDGFVDDVYGADMVQADGNPDAEVNHGTNIAGVIASPCGNGLGGCGIAPDARVMIVRVVGHGGYGNNRQLAAGLRFALAHGARVVNISLGGYGPTAELRRAFVAARRRGVLVVAAAGNAREDLDRRPQYPASFPGVLAVASSDGYDRLNHYSARGRASVALAAPGSSIYGPQSYGRYGSMDGTSQAAAVVSGAAALLAARCPGCSGDALARALCAGALRPAPLLPYVRCGRVWLPGALAALAAEKPA